LFRGNKKEKAYYKKQIEHLIKKYPKREENKDGVHDA